MPIPNAHAPDNFCDCKLEYMSETQVYVTWSAAWRASHVYVSMWGICLYIICNVWTMTWFLTGRTDNIERHNNRRPIRREFKPKYSTNQNKLREIKNQNNEHGGKNGLNDKCRVLFCSPKWYRTPDGNNFRDINQYCRRMKTPIRLRMENLKRWVSLD